MLVSQISRLVARILGLGTTLYVLILFLPMTSVVIRAESAETKRAELVKLVHYTGELKSFKGDVIGMISSLKESKPEMPLWFWTVLEKEANADEYLQWVIHQYFLALSEQDLRQLNAFLGNAQKKAVFEELGRLLSETPKQNIPVKIAEFSQTRSRELMDEVTSFAQSEVFAKYVMASEKKDAGRREKVVKLMFEADRRIRAREAAKQDPNAR